MPLNEKMLHLLVEGPQAGFDIIVNGKVSEEKSPAKLELQAGDTLIIDRCCWIVRGSEKYLRFKRKNFAEGTFYLLDSGAGEQIIGIDFASIITQESFDRHLRERMEIFFVLADDCPQIRRIDALAGHQNGRNGRRAFGRFAKHGTSQSRR